MSCAEQRSTQGPTSAIESDNEHESDQSELEKYLVCAAEKGDLEEVKRLVKAGADVMGRYFPPLGTSICHGLEILKIFNDRPRALVRLIHYFGTRETERGVQELGWTPLQAASAGGHLSTVQFLIDSGGDVNDPAGTAAGRTALLWAAGTNNLELMQLLLDQGAKINVPAARLGSVTALQMAAERGCEETVDLLLRRGADINQIAGKNFGRTALQAACSQGQLRMVQHLLDRGALINNSSSESSGLTALSAAAGEGHLDIFKALIKKGADVNEKLQNTRDQTALQAAARKGHLEIVKLLLEHGAEVNDDVGNVDGRSALQSAVEQGNKDMVKLLIARNANVNEIAGYQNGTSALQAAAASGNIQMVELLLAAGAIVNQSAGDNNGRTPLQAAAEKGHLDIVKLLIARGASTNETPSPTSGRTSLQAAASKGHMEIARLLIDNRAEINAQAPADAFTALQAAASEGHQDMVRWLVSLGADVNAPGAEGEGRTALQAAAEHGHVEIARFLLEEGAEVNAKASASYKGVTALQAAALGGHIDVVKILLGAPGVSVNEPLEYQDAQTPLQAAAKSGNIDIAKCLHASGADINAKPAKDGGQTALQAAAEQGHQEMVRWLLTLKADIHAKGAEWRGVTAIEAAVRGGHKEIVAMLVSGSGGVSMSLAFGLAAKQGDLHLIKMLHSKGANVDGVTEGEERDDSKSNSPLQAAATRGAYDVIRFLLDNKADINVPALRDGRTVLQTASARGHLQIVKYLLSKGGDVNAVASETGGRTALQGAAEGGHLDVVEYLLSKQADVNAVAADVDGRTALQAALENNHREVVLRLLKADANVYDTIGDNGQSALHRLCDDENLGLFRALVETCAEETLNLKDFSGSTALHLAVEGNHIEIIKCLLDIQHLDMEICDILGNTPLRIAIEKSHKGTAKLLLTKGARTDGLTLKQLHVVAHILEDKHTAPMGNMNDDQHFILLCHNHSNGTHVKTTSREMFNVDEWERNPKTSILFPSSYLQREDSEIYKSFVKPSSFVFKVEYPDIPEEGSLIKWAWAPFIKRLQSGVELHPFRIGVPTNQDMKSGVFFVPYIRLDWPRIYVKAPPLSIRDTAAPGNTSPDVKGFTSNERMIEISWIMAKRSRNEKELASTMQTIYYRGNLTWKAPSIPGSAAEFVVWFLVDVCDHWTALLDKAAQQLVKIRDFQLAAEGRNPDVIKSLLTHSREWYKLRETLRKHVTQASDLLKQFKEREALFGELISTIKKPKKDQFDKTHNTKMLHGALLSPAAIPQDYDLVATENERLFETCVPEPGMVTHAAAQVITRNAKNLQHIIVPRPRTPRLPPPSPRVDQAGQPAELGALEKIWELEKRVDFLKKDCENRLSDLDKETKEMIELEFNLVSIYEARKSVKMSESMKRLSWITFIFLPLMFVAGLFGMNVDVLEVNPSWKWYPISAAPFMAFVMLAWFLFKCTSIPKFYKWHKTRDPASVTRNPRDFFGRMRKWKRDEEMGYGTKEHND